MIARIWSIVLITLASAGCGRYADFTLPPASGPKAAVTPQWRMLSEPVLIRGTANEWDSVDVLNPSVVITAEGYLNFYSGFDGKVWRTGLANSQDGIAWRKQGQILGPDPHTWEGSYIAANGAALLSPNDLLYYYQAGDPPRIGLAQKLGDRWRKIPAPVLGLGPLGSWDERGVADPYVLATGGKFYLYYMGMDRGRRQRLGVAVSADGLTWSKLRSNPVLDEGGYGAFDEAGLGEPAVWAARGWYWMLYTGRSHAERRRLGLARSIDGVHWKKLDIVMEGNHNWDSQVLCDPSVVLEGNEVRVWFGGGDRPRPDENIDGQIGYATLSLEP